MVVSTKMFDGELSQTPQVTWAIQTMPLAQVP